MSANGAQSSSVANTEDSDVLLTSSPGLLLPEPSTLGPATMNWGDVSTHSSLREEVFMDEISFLAANPVLEGTVMESNNIPGPDTANSVIARSVVGNPVSLLETLVLVGQS